MKVQFKTFQCGLGDCIFLILRDETDNLILSIMVDCGNFVPKIESFLCNELNLHISMLIVTHIDNDHINGIVQMLKKYPTLKIDRIFFNCNQAVNREKNLPESDSLKENKERLRNHLSPDFIRMDGKVNAEVANTLAGLILRNESWRKVWYPNYITRDTPIIDLGDNMGKLRILSPTNQQLSVLDEKFKRMFHKFTGGFIPNEPFANQEEYYEIVQRLQKAIDVKVRKNKKMAAHYNSIDDANFVAASKVSPSGISEENEASIAFEWVCGEKSILFMGDAEPRDVIDGLEKYYGDKQHIYDIIKVSHHGSLHSTSQELLNHIDSLNYFCTGGNNTDKPSLEAIAKIALRPINAAIPRRTIHCNRISSPLMKQLASDALLELKTKYHFSLIESDELAFSY